MHKFATTQDLLIMRCATDHRSHILLIRKVTLICSGCMLHKNTYLILQEIIIRSFLLLFPAAISQTDKN